MICFRLTLSYFSALKCSGWSNDFSYGPVIDCLIMSLSKISCEHRLKQVVSFLDSFNPIQMRPPETII